MAAWGWQSVGSLNFHLPLGEHTSVTVWPDLQDTVAVSKTPIEPGYITAMSSTVLAQILCYDVMHPR